jgi:hypothetical protein
VWQRPLGAAAAAEAATVVVIPAMAAETRQQATSSAGENRFRILKKLYLTGESNEEINDKIGNSPIRVFRMSVAFINRHDDLILWI